MENLYRSGVFGRTRRGKAWKPLRVGHFLPYPSRKSRKTSTGRPFFALPVKKNPQNLYRSAVFGLTRRGKAGKPLQVGGTASGWPPRRTQLRGYGARRLRGARRKGSPRRRPCQQGCRRRSGTGPWRGYLFCSATEASWMVLKMRLMKSMSMP